MVRNRPTTRGHNSSVSVCVEDLHLCTIRLAPTSDHGQRETIRQPPLQGVPTKGPDKTPMQRPLRSSDQPYGTGKPGDKNNDRTILRQNHRKWDENIPELMFAINTAQHTSTGFSPAFLNYGREPRPPQRLNDNQPDNIPTPRQTIEETAEIVRINISKAFARKSHHYNLHQDQVYIKTHYLSDAFKAFTSKLAPKFAGPFPITKFLSPLNPKGRNSEK